MTTIEVAGVLLAAGEASRFRAAAGADGPETKLVAQHRGKALVRHVAEAGLAAGLAPLVVVTGHAQDAVRAALADLPLIYVHNANYAGGMASSLKAGLAQLPSNACAALVLLGDMPLVSPALIAKLVAAFANDPQAIAVLPVHEGVRGNPVLLSRAVFAEIMQLSGDAGARQVLRGRDADVVEVDVDESAARLDVDTPAALRDLAKD
ncbi:MAG: 4-diphosphocytidyl-2C-methyl-D-erythritol kinase [Hyphomicrobiales bacterium]|nr:4-diphosphocytidyl-2C-methyl-D-erythritol kinase [Hyphomicrobiales bacterium]